MSFKPTPVAYKSYKCERCGNEEEHQTNHFGHIYNIKCKGCAWKNPTQPFTSFKCLEKSPKPENIPPKWTNKLSIKLV